VGNLNPLKYCFYGAHAKPRATFRTFPGAANKRAVCSDCYEQIMAENKRKESEELAVRRGRPK
jgi:hypothetical protein